MAFLPFQPTEPKGFIMFTAPVAVNMHLVPLSST